MVIAIVFILPLAFVGTVAVPVISNSNILFYPSSLCILYLVFIGIKYNCYLIEKAKGEVK